MAGTLRGEGTLAVANGAYVVLLLAWGSRCRSKVSPPGWGALATLTHRFT